MKEHDLEYFKQILIQKKESQYKKIERFEDMNEIDYTDGKELSLYDNHPADIGSETYEIEKNMALKQQMVRQLKETEEALRNIENGNYGICSECGQDISLERLRTVPTSNMCIDCQDESEGDIETTRPIEEESLYPPYNKATSNDVDNVEYDDEDAWQDVAKYNKSKNIALDWYDNNFYDNDEMEKMDNITNEEYFDQLPDD